MRAMGVGAVALGLLVLWAAGAAAQEATAWLSGAPVVRPQAKLSGLQVMGSSAMTWSPDGRFVLFAERAGERTRLILLTVATLQRATRLDMPEIVETMRWSPDGKWVAYTTRNVAGPPYGVFLLPMPRGVPRGIGGGAPPASQFEWSPDATRLALAFATGETTHEVHVWEVATEREVSPVPVLGATLWAFGPKWSPDGRRLAVADAAGTTAMVPIGEGPRAPAPEGWRGLAPSPDVRYVVGWLGAEPGVLDTISGTVAPIALREGTATDLPDMVIDRGPVWFGDSSAFALVQDGRLWVVTAATGRGRPVGPPQASGSPRLEQTGPHGAVAYHQWTGSEARSGFYLLDGPSAEPRRLLGRESAPYHGWRWSPDGRWGEYTFRVPKDWHDAAAGSVLWWALLNTRTGKLYRLDTEGMEADRHWPLFWSPVCSQAIVWYGDEPRLLTLPGR